MTTVNSSTSSLAQMMAMLRQSHTSTSTASTNTSSDDTSTTIDTKQKAKQEPFVSGQMALNGDTFSTLLASQSVGASSQAEGESDFQEAFDSWYSGIDTDNSGTLSKDEFVAAKPDTVTAEEAASLYDQIDSESTDALTESQLAYGLVMASQVPPPPPPQEESTETSSVDDMFSAMDTDGDGAVTKEEFLAAKPDDVTDEMAEALYASMDTEGTGSITKEQLASSMQGSSSNVASSGGGGGGGGSSSTKEVVSETTVTNPDKSTTTTTTYSDGTTVTETTPASASASTSATSTDDAVDAFLKALFGNTREPPSAEEMFSKMDSDGDSVVSKAEFVAARPKDVTEAESETLYNSIDTEGTGSITEDQLAESMQKRDDSTAAASTSTTTTTTEATATQTASEAFLEAILGRKSTSSNLEAILASLESSMGASLG